MVIYLLTQCRKVRQDNQLQGLCPAYLPYKNNIHIKGLKDVDFFIHFFYKNCFNLKKKCLMHAYKLVNKMLILLYFFLQCFFCLFVCLIRGTELWKKKNEFYRLKMENFT